MKAETKKIISQYKFCFKCGGQLVHKQHNSFVCNKCGFKFYLNPTFTTGAFLENEKGEILLVERKVDPKKGYWDTPGGFVDLEENAEAGMLRELKEELGVKPESLTYFMSTTDTYLWDGVLLALVALIYVGKINSSTKIIPTDDVAGYKFFKRNELPFGKIAFEGVEQALKEYTKNHK